MLINATIITDKFFYMYSKPYHVNFLFSIYAVRTRTVSKRL